MKYMVADNLKNFKEVNNLSLRETARQVKISHVIVSQFVNKKRCTARIDIICKIANSLDVNLDDLLFTNIKFKTN